MSNFNRHLKIHRNEKLFHCEVCMKMFGRRSNYLRHKMTHETVKTSTFACKECEEVFTRVDNLNRHLKLHQGSSFPCLQCDKVLKRKEELRQHLRSHHPRASLVSVKRKALPKEKVKKARDALNVFKTLKFFPSENNQCDLKVFQIDTQPLLEERLRSEVQEKGALKWYLVVKLALERSTDEGLEVIDTYFRCECYTELVEDEIPHHLEEGFSKMNTSFEEFMQRGSNWVLQKIHYLELKVAKYQPLVGSSYIPLPQKIQDKKAILNVKNEDAKCFIWCLIAHKLNLDYTQKPERIAHYQPFEHMIQLGDVTCPVSLRKISIIEKLNNLRINVFGFDDEEDEVTPLYISPRNDHQVINLLLISDGEKQHYTLIRSFSRLLGNRTKHQHMQYYCFRCLHGFSRQDLLEEHIKYCQEQTVQAIKMPDPQDNILKFTGIHLQHPVAYTIYADFESLLIPISSARPTSHNSYTEKTHYHMPCGYAYVIIGPDGHPLKPISVYRGTNAVKHFLHRMMEEKEELGPKLMNITSMKLSTLEETAFDEATHCSICQKPLGSSRCHDHDHLTGSFRGATHPGCNINYKQPKTIPVIFHNLRHYDGHHIMTQLGKFKDHQIDVIASTLDQYIAFKIKKPHSQIQMAFIDSFQHLPTSLEKLVLNLDESQFNILKSQFPSHTDFSLLTRKGIYPYDYMTSFKKFDEKMLPPPEAFFNSLTDEAISCNDYQHAQNVWTTFKLRTLGDYHNLYVMTDVLLLADVFENYRRLCMQYYSIDSAHLFTAPSLAWQACLKMSDVSLDLLTDVNMLLMMENGIRGGISMISQRYAKANIPHTSQFNPEDPSSYILYLDANNLYGWAMSQFLPYGKFKWSSTEHITEEWILSLSDTSEDGFIFEVDLEYPDKLHDSHNDYPLAPERLTVTESMLSSYAQSLLKRKFIGTPKLIPNLCDKNHYIIHYRNLKLYLQLGLKLTAVHKAISFKQAPWLQSYIQFNTEKRKEATSSFEKDFFKLLNNSVYGKTMENLRKRRNIELCNNEKRAKKLVASPTFKAFKTFNEDLTAVERLKPSILMNRPIYVGFTILELSKLLMYEFHYEFIKPTYQDNARLLFTDTDSLTYHITTDNIVEDLQHHAKHFDFSDYPKEHPLYSEVNKKKIGKFKDELNGEFALEFVGLKAKMYSIKSVISEKKRAKGVCTPVVKQKIRHQDYVDCLQQKKTSLEKQKRIAQDAHELFSVTQNKISLSPFDDKRYLLDDGISSLAYGHYLLRDENL